MTSIVPQEEELDQALFPIALLLEELRNEDLQLRLNGTRRIKMIADALGPERTRGELLPFLAESIDDEDEVLLALAEELGDFVSEVGGTQHASLLVQPLENLATVEDTIVRDKAVHSLKRLSTHVTESSPQDAKTLHVEHMHPLVQRLASGDWFTSRISACALFATVYEQIPADHSDLRTDIIAMYQGLAHDETPMVRRAAAANLASIAKSIFNISPELVRTELLPVFSELVEDEQDSVRLLVVECAAVFARLLVDDNGKSQDQTDTQMSSEANGSEPAHGSDKPPEQPNGEEAKSADGGNPTSNGPFPPRGSSDRIIDMVRRFSGDKSWRVRYMVADQLSELCDALGPVATRSDLLPAYLRVLKDNEPEVRTAAAFKVTELTKRIVSLPASTKEGELSGMELTLRDILPIVGQLVTDASQHVRAALASNIMGLAPEVGVEVTISHLVEVVLALLKDEYPDVRLNVISRLDKVSFIMSIERLSNELLPAIVDLAEDKNWRVRLAIINHVPLLARQLGKEFFQNNSKIGDLCILWLGDCVYSIREAAIANIKSLTEVFGVEWANRYIIPPVLSMYDKSSNYLLRMTSLHAIGVLSEVVGSETVEKTFLPMVTERASRDPVPNVRFCSAKTLNQVIPYVRKDLRESKIRPCLLSLLSSTEKDKDVNYFAEIALQTLRSCPS